MKMHKSITYKRVERLVKKQMTTLANPGICLACGRTGDGCEPDAREYPCEHCGKNEKYGAEEILFMM